MSEGYLDVNQSLFRAAFESAHAWAPYLTRSDPKHAQRWRAAYEGIHLTAAQAALLSGFTRRIHLLVLSGVWCGDCSRQGPIFQRLSEAAPGLELRFAERDEDEGLTDLLRINGAKKVPVAVFLSEDFYEVQRFGDRTLSIYRARAQREFGAACATGLVPPEPEALATEVSEWVDILERVHILLRTAPLLRARHGD
jgi:thiol-disulfide isomerase/thioredoxin